jgi:PAS domain S-box-containing protein
MPSKSKKDDSSYEPIAELVKINPVPSMIMDMETLTIVVMNEAAARLLGRGEKELLGKSVLDFLPPADIPEAHRAAAEPVPEGETQWRCVVEGKTLYVKVKYRDTRFRGRPARFIVATGITSSAIDPS